jgi:hypothetical protein
MGKLASVKLKVQPGDLCGCGMGKQQKHKCCKDEVKIFKIDDKQQLAVANIEFAAIAAVLPVTFMLNDAAADQRSFIALHYNSPPRQSSNEVYLRQCVFRL